MPAGNYRFRADKNGTQFWSGSSNHCTVPGCTSVTIVTMPPLTVLTVQDNGVPQAGLPVYAYDGDTYTGYNGTTNASGQYTFTLPAGSYRFRADKNGTQFWSGSANHCTVPGCTSATISISLLTVVTVQDTNNTPQVGLPVYAYSGTTYQNYNGTTSASGQVTFTLPAGNYRFRTDKNGTQFWSGPTNHCTVPGCTSVVITVSVPVVVSVRDTDGAPGIGLPVYAFSGTTYMNYNGTTNASGQVTLTLPLGSYRFRADKNGTQFWSDAANHCSIPGCTSTVVTVSVPVVVSVRDTDEVPGVGLPVYAFSGTTYMNYNGTTSMGGQVTLTLPLGNYRFRTDKNGTQFWSGASNHCAVPGCVSAVVTVSVPVVVIVQDGSGAPQASVPVYAFDGSTYTNYNGTTNASGQVTLTLPLGNYRFRADKNGTQYWSGPSNHCAVPGCASVTITLTTGCASNGGRALAQTRLPINDPGLLLLAPLAVLALSRRKGKRQRWATLAAVLLLAVAVMGLGTTLAGDQDLRGLADLSGLQAAPQPASVRASDVHAFAPQVSTIAPRPAAAQVLTTTTTVIRYTYDPLQRLTSATYSDGKSFQYQYDAVGNRTISTQTITSTLVTSYTYDAANRLTSVNGQAYTWDANGNLLSDGSKTYLHNQANQLITVTAPGLTWSAAYNGDGARLKQTVNGAETAYTLDLAAPLVIVLAQHATRDTQYVYGQGDSPLASYDGTLSEVEGSGVEGWTYLSGRDGVNSVRQETDASGNVLALRSFDPYGVPLSGDGGVPFGYTGEVWDVPTQLVFLRARYMQPGLGMFLSRDLSYGNIL